MEISEQLYLKREKKLHITVQSVHVYMCTIGWSEL